MSATDPSRADWEAPGDNPTRPVTPIIALSPSPVVVGGAGAVLPATLPVRRLGRFATSTRAALGAWAVDAFVWIVAILIPTLLTTSAKEVLQSRPTWHASQWSWRANLFWLGLWSAPFLFWMKQWANAAVNRSVEGRIAAARAEARQQTAEMLTAAALTQNDVHVVYTGALVRQYADLPAASTVGLLQTDIRLVLSTIAELVAELEPPRPGAQFGVNLMQYLEIDQQRPQLPPEVDACRLFESDLRLAEQRGVLYLDRELSISTEVESDTRDPNLVSLTLCVPRTTVVDGVLQMLPGAPYAFVKRDMIRVDATDLVRLCRDGSHAVHPATADRLEHYLGSDVGRAIRTILCHPLMQVEGKQPRAVLNIHSNYPGMLADEDRRQQLYYLLRPRALVLLKLLDLLREQQGRLAAETGAGTPVQPRALLPATAGAASHGAPRSGGHPASPRAGARGRNGSSARGTKKPRDG